ncbi:uncharacterized protein LOC103574532 isoform X2 [Microplitis demolitor]|uniref:uncharacterized protein LOC103574532 isoform X2 n=1 Tax=Microplitis demolitor TaxID=69319 RepID=UPI0004CDC52B|nr:uncharacterized protein LOC103574532 isoform X2 [Microplitis demolitor]
MEYCYTFYLFLLLISEEMCEGKLWCYKCNADLSMGHKGDCNDPYAPAPSIDLAACPDNESHYCLKAFVYYKHIHTTVRGCVPSRSKSTYCNFETTHPEALVTCLFCSGNGCNRSPRLEAPLSTLLTIVSLWTLIATFTLHKL